MSEEKKLHDYNCAQKVFSSVMDELDIDEEQGLKTAVCFGGGMAKGEVCGCVTGALMAIGMKYGSADPEDVVAKQLADQYADQYIKAFKEKFGSILCRELLDIEDFTPESRAAARESGVMAQRCPNFIAFGQETLKGIIKD